MSPSLSIEPALAPEIFEPLGPDERTEPPFPPRPRDRTPPSPPAPRALSASARPRLRRRARPLLPPSPSLFPWLARRFSPGELTVWAGPPAAVEPLLELLYVGSARVRGNVSLLEGANRFHPYRLGELGRALGVDARETVRRIRLARAFTAYQMVALVERWGREVRRHPPTLLVGHDLTALFTDDEIPAEEQAGLLRRMARNLGALLGRADLPLLLTLGPDGASRFPGLVDQGPRWFDYVTLERGAGTLRLRAMRDDARLTLVARAPGQLGMETFGGGPSAGEVAAWDVPPRRTARRSRNA
ncbi:MAG TPA: hypothetical protein VMH49_06915 [Thermoplasmata archaeon]|nr:hypothetical protein [Thermoplasmata archaeon]